MFSFCLQFLQVRGHGVSYSHTGKRRVVFQLLNSFTSKPKRKRGVGYEQLLSKLGFWFSDPLLPSGGPRRTSKAPLRKDKYRVLGVLST